MRRPAAAPIAVLAVLCVLSAVAALAPLAAAAPGTGTATGTDSMEGSDEGIDALPPGTETQPRSTSAVLNDPLVNHEITFPVEGANTYTDTFGACRDGCSRSHEGVDIMASKMQRIMAAASGTVTALKHEADGNYVFVTGDDGWQYWYIHVNNDTPGTDDGANKWEHAFAPGVELGAKVTRGQHIAYVGDSGNAEYTAPHLHFEMHKPDGSWGGQVVNPYYSLKISQGIAVAGLCDFNRNPDIPQVGTPTSAGGYWLLDDRGGVLSYGRTSWHGGLDGRSDVTAIASTRDATGYWISLRNGRVLPFGTARHYGDARGKGARIVNVTRTYSGYGYWLVADDGRVFTYGDARQYGYPRGARTKFVGMNRTASGAGYWLLDDAGRVFAYGNARDYGEMRGARWSAVGIASTSSNNGYWVLTKDGRVTGFGDARDHGSPSRLGLCDPSSAVRIRRTASGNGYWVAMSNGDVHQFGDAYDFGDPNDPPWWHYPILDMAIQPYR